MGDRRLAANALDTLGELHMQQGEPAAALAWRMGWLDEQLPVVLQHAPAAVQAVPAVPGA